MLEKIFYNETILSKALEGTWLRHQAITNNIANANTPNYKKIDVSFEDVLFDKINNRKLQLRNTNLKHISKSNDIEDLKPKIKRLEGYSTRKDGNNVNIDVENANLAKNAIMYNALIRQISWEFERLSTIINGGSNQ